MTLVCGNTKRHAPLRQGEGRRTAAEKIRRGEEGARETRPIPSLADTAPPGGKNDWPKTKRPGRANQGDKGKGQIGFVLIAGRASCLETGGNKGIGQAAKRGGETSSIPASRKPKKAFRVS